MKTTNSATELQIQTAGLTRRHVAPGGEPDQKALTTSSEVLCGLLKLLQVLVVVLILVVVLGRRQQAGDVADAFGDALSEEQLGAQPQVLGVFDEAESNHGSLSSSQLVLQPQNVMTLNRTRRTGQSRYGIYTLTFPWRHSTVAVCLTLPTCTVTCDPRRKVLAWKSRTMAASN